MAELVLVVEEAEADFDSLRQLIAHSEVQSGDRYLLGAQARIAVANACVLYVAAAFEEAVRQLGEAYVDALVAKSQIPAPKLNALRSGLWERMASALIAKPFGTSDFVESVAEKNIQVLKDFCLHSNDVELAKGVSVYNQRNMRAKEVNNVFKRIGVINICNKVGRCNEFKAFFLVDTVAKAQDEFILFLNEFYETRNQATHELGTFRSQGTVDTKRYIEFFVIAIRRLAAVLTADLAAIP